jgi:SM-20-related protein
MNPDLPVARFAESYRREGVVQIPDFFDAPSAELLEEAMRRTPWELALPTETGEQETFRTSGLDPAATAEFKAKVRAAVDRGRSGFSYVYLSYPMIEAYKAGRDPELGLHRFTEFVNGEAFLDFARALIGEPRVERVDAHASNYRPGDFLTLHDDRGVSRDRFAAYTFGLTRGWRPDWGGQLQFHDEAGDVVRGLLPRFNVLCVFRVPQWLSVAPVAPYAGEPRLSITGWMRARTPIGV